MAVTTHQAADFGAQRIVTLRIFNGHIHRLGLLVLVEALVVGGALYAATLARHGTSEAFAAWQAMLVPAVFVTALPSQVARTISSATSSRSMVPTVHRPLAGS